MKISPNFLKKKINCFVFTLIFTWRNVHILLALFYCTNNHYRRSATPSLYLLHILIVFWKKILKYLLIYYMFVVAQPLLCCVQFIFRKCFCVSLRLVFLRSICTYVLSIYSFNMESPVAIEFLFHDFLFVSRKYVENVFNFH